MHPSQQQPEFQALPAPPSISSPVTSQMRGHSSTSQDTNMEDASYNSSYDDSPSKEARGLNLNFLRTKPKTTKDGVPAKKRGPKRDSKPAISRRQELNRQAQRTHRERKEYYTKALENEVSRTRELYSILVNEKVDLQKRNKKLEKQLKDNNLEALRHENDRLKQLLQVNGITYDRLLPVVNGLPTATQPQELHVTAGAQMPTINRHISPIQSQTSTLNGYQNSLQSHDSFNSQPSSFAASQSDTHAAMRQQYMGNTTTIVSNSPQQHMPPSASPVSPSQPPMQEGLFQYHHQHPASMGGSTYAASVPNSVPNSGRPSPTHTDTLSRKTSRQDSGGIDSMLVDSSSTFRPPVGQGIVDGRVVRNTSDERVKQLNMNHDQLGIDFVLALESNCKDHQVYLNMRANPPATEDLNYELSGHAMMLTNPLPSHLAMGPEKCHHEPPDMPTLSLVKLMETAQRLPLEGGEIPPILALRVIREDERYGLITEKDFRKITNKLRESSRCYGFGAVLETFEVQDALDSVLGSLTV